MPRFNRQQLLDMLVQCGPARDAGLIGYHSSDAVSLSYHGEDAFKHLQRAAAALGFDLVERPSLQEPVTKQLAAE